MVLLISLSIASILIGIVCMTDVIISIIKGSVPHFSLILFILNGICGIVFGTIIIDAAYKNLITENNVSSIMIALLIFIFFALTCIAAVFNEQTIRH